MKYAQIIGKIVLLIMGLLPVIFFTLLFTIAGPHVESKNVFLVVMTLVSGLVPFVLFVYYSIHVCRNNRMTKENKYLWIAILFFGHILAFPFYWYMYIWNKPRNITENAY